MLDDMSSHLLAEWMAYSRLEPFGDELLDAHLANLASILINTNRKKGSAAVTPQKLRLWKTAQAFDAQVFYENLKTALTMNFTPDPSPFSKNENGEGRKT